MMIRYAVALGAFAVLATPMVAEAQGLIGGAQEGAAQGNRDAGPIGGVVGGAIGAGVGTVNGALGIHPGYYHHRCHWHNGQRYCRY